MKVLQPVDVAGDEAQLMLLLLPHHQRCLASSLAKICQRYAFTVSMNSIGGC
jgi:hypothetical protein